MQRLEIYASRFLRNKVTATSLKAGARPPLPAAHRSTWVTEKLFLSRLTAHPPNSSDKWICDAQLRSFKESKANVYVLCIYLGTAALKKDEILLTGFEPNDRFCFP